MNSAQRYWRVALKEPHPRRFAFTTSISQIGIRYQNSFLSQRPTVGSSICRESPGIGCPLARIWGGDDGGVNSHDKVGQPGFHLLLFPGVQSDTKSQSILDVALPFAGRLFAQTVLLTEKTQPALSCAGIKHELLFGSTLICLSLIEAAFRC